IDVDPLKPAVLHAQIHQGVVDGPAPAPIGPAREVDLRAQDPGVVKGDALAATGDHLTGGLEVRATLSAVGGRATEGDRDEQQDGQRGEETGSERAHLDLRRQAARSFERTLSGPTSAVADER